MSDGAKRLGEIEVQMTLHALQVSKIRCTYNLTIKNWKTRYTNGVRCAAQIFVCENAQVP